MQPKPHIAVIATTQPSVPIPASKIVRFAGETIVTKPTINPNGTSPGELLEQHLLAINGLRSAISTLVAAAPNGRDYQHPDRHVSPRPDRSRPTGSHGSKA